jgi:hypothetical protein
MAGKFRFVALGVIVIGLALGVVFGLGVKYGQGKTPQATGGLTPQQLNQALGIGTGGVGAGGAGGGAGAGGAGAAGGGAGGSGAAGGATNGGGTAHATGRATPGRITAVQGQTVTIELRPGVTQKFNLGAQSVVNKTSTGAGADLKEGSSVIITGTRNADGSFDATTVNRVAPELAQVLGGTTTGAAPTTPSAPPASTPGAPAPSAPAAPAATPAR